MGASGPPRTAHLPRSPSYILAHFVLLRLLGFVYAVAFLVLIHHQDALIDRVSSSHSPRPPYPNPRDIWAAPRGSGYLASTSLPVVSFMNRVRTFFVVVVTTQFTK